MRGVGKQNKKTSLKNPIEIDEGSSISISSRIGILKHRSHQIAFKPYF